MDRANLTRDINTLVALGIADLTSSGKQPSSDSTPASATTVLDTLSVGNSTPDESQALTKAYINAMRQDIMNIKTDESENIGSRLDSVRGKAEGTQGALSNVSGST